MQWHENDKRAMRYMYDLGRHMQIQWATCTLPRIRTFEFLFWAVGEWIHPASPPICIHVFATTVERTTYIVRGLSQAVFWYYFSAQQRLSISKSFCRLGSMHFLTYAPLLPLLFVVTAMTAPVSIKRQDDGGGVSVPGIEKKNCSRVY